MRRRWMIGIICFTSLLSPQLAEAVCEDGGGDVKTLLFVNGSTGRYIFSNAHADRSVTSTLVCLGKVRAEAWLHGVSGMKAQQGYKSASPVHRWDGPAYGRWYGSGNYYFIKKTGSWHHLGLLTKSKTLGPAPNVWNYEIEDCYANGGKWNSATHFCDIPSPLVVDLAGNSVRFTSAAGGVWFDLDADGVAELTAWTEAGSDDSFVVLDRNGNGQIDNGAELFGTATPLFPDLPEPLASQGFEALAALQHPAYGASRLDSFFDRQDGLYEVVQLWTDFNHDGLSQPEELQALRTAAVRSILLTFSTSQRVDPHGNELRYFSQVQVGRTQRLIVDVFLRRVNGT